MILCLWLKWQKYISNTVIKYIMVCLTSMMSFPILFLFRKQ